jgi:hypothetical protein
MNNWFSIPAFLITHFSLISLFASIPNYFIIFANNFMKYGIKSDNKLKERMEWKGNYYLKGQSQH